MSKYANYQKFVSKMYRFVHTTIYREEICGWAKEFELGEILALFESSTTQHWYIDEILEYIEKHNLECNKEECNLKMYIAVLDEFPDFMVPTLVAHAVLAADREFAGMKIYDQWFDESFKKVVVRVNQKEFDKISQLFDVHLAHENKTLGGKKACAVVCPREENPNVLKFAKTWKPREVS